MKICYTPKRFNRQYAALLGHVQSIVQEYVDAGYEMTVRQVYYQIIARNLFPDEWLVKLESGQLTKNHLRNYRKLGELISTARLAGMISWTAIQDRNREVVTWRHDTSVEDALQQTADRYNLDKWLTQKRRVEVWVEKDALASVLQRPCSRWGLPVFACRGYASQSSAWEAHQRVMEFWHERKQKTVIFHFGDHDPSGLDMTRDIIDRMNLFNAKFGFSDLVEVRRLALNIDQVKKFNPPPSPAKESDPRAKDYEAMYGEDSWELDALSPKQLDELVTDELKSIIDSKAWARREAEEQTDISAINKAVELINNPPSTLDEPTDVEYMQAHQYLYYVEATPVLSDYDYDKWCKRHGLNGKGGSDSEASYTTQVKALAFLIKHGKKPQLP